MTELQSILKETLARWEAETQTTLQQHEQQIMTLRAELHQIERLHSAQTAHWQHLEELCWQLEPLLQKLNAVLPKK